ncbi:MAG TPA: hypothetical protein VGK70_12755 [Thermoanaerobaculia bacterium]
MKAISASLPLDPGDDVSVQGCGFGLKAPGSDLRLMGDFPGGFIKLETKTWNGYSITARVPDVKGAKDDPNAKLQVVLKDSTFSTWQTAGFRASREVLKLKPWDVDFHCTPYLDVDICDLATNHLLADSQFFGGATFAARHDAPHVEYAGDYPCKEFPHIGFRINPSDSAAVSLKNGWVLAGYAWWWRYQITPNLGYVEAPLGFHEGAKSSNIVVESVAVADDCEKPPKRGGVSYRVDLYIIGPAGVPHR